MQMNIETFVENKNNSLFQNCLQMTLEQINNTLETGSRT